MKSLPASLLLFSFFLSPAIVRADEAGTQLAARLRAKESGTAYIRAKMETAGAVLQVQIKSRVTAQSADIVYQILFPKERKGEAVVLHRSGGRMSGTVRSAAGETQPLTADQMGNSLFGTALSYADVIDNPAFWDSQAIVGTETIYRVESQKLESKPGGKSVYSKVLTWVDPSRLVPFRIEKTLSGGPQRKIEVTRFQKDGDDSLPIDLTVTSPDGMVSRVSGSSIKRGPSFTDEDFSPEGLAGLAPPK